MYNVFDAKTKYSEVLATANTNSNIGKRKFKHLNPYELGKIWASLNEGSGVRYIAKQLGRNLSTISREIKKGTTTQLKSSLETFNAYFPETGQAVYEYNRLNCGHKNKLVEVEDFITFAEQKILKDKLSPDAVVGSCKDNPEWKDKPMVCTKTLYNYINEHHNGIVRRFIPKGKSLKDISVSTLKRIERWINNLPRKILGYMTPEECFKNIQMSEIHHSFITTTGYSQKCLSSVSKNFTLLETDENRHN